MEKFPVQWMAGLFFSAKNRLHFVDFTDDKEFLSFTDEKVYDSENIRCIPDNYSVAASSGGLILCRRARWPYCVANLLHGVCVFLPAPPESIFWLSNVPMVALVAIKEEDTYRVVCVFRKSDQVSLVFMMFSSITGDWVRSEWQGGSGIGSIISNSSVSCGTRAYWRTSTPSLVWYDVASGDMGLILEIPTICSTPLASWQLGMISMNRLCLVCVSESSLELYYLKSSGSFEKMKIENKDGSSDVVICGPNNQTPKPMRFEGFKLQVPFWLGNRVVFLQEMECDTWSCPSDKGPATATVCIRELEHEFGEMQPDSPEDCVPLEAFSEARADFPSS